MPQEIIELCLGKDRGNPDTASAKSLFDRLLALVSERPTPGEDRRLVELRSSIEGHRLKIGAARDWSEIQDATTICLEVCQEYFEVSRNHYRERETAIEEVIAVLREAVETIAREAGDFNSQLLSSSNRLTSIAEITDLRQIKRRISDEVEGLKTMVAERKKQEEAIFSRLSRRAETLSRQLEQARDEASRDPLTRIANRGGFDRAIDRWIASHWKRSGAFCLAMLDVDNFKIINDTHGHPVGDRVLTTIAERLQSAIRDNDFAARYGGEEFVVLLEVVKTAAARDKMNELLATIARVSYEYKKGGEPQRLQFTLSCGLTEYTNNDTRDTLVARADEALYEAKHNGKNRVEVKKASLLATLFSASPSTRS
jgi:diguanylate cyclase